MFIEQAKIAMLRWTRGFFLNRLGDFRSATVEICFHFLQVKYLQQRIDILQDDAEFTRSKSLRLSPGAL